MSEKKFIKLKQIVPVLERIKKSMDNGEFVDKELNFKLKEPGDEYALRLVLSFVLEEISKEETDSN